MLQNVPFASFIILHTSTEQGVAINQFVPNALFKSKDRILIHQNMNNPTRQTLHLDQRCKASQKLWFQNQPIVHIVSKLNLA
jgi:hypothetical protein